LFKESNKKKMKMSWENIVISAIPKTKKCGRAIVPVPQPKVILNEVSGTVFPGQFLAIIGASGKLIIEC
jgi:ABC-type protease/lipase transport system fused ATPase/permease subunit